MRVGFEKLSPVYANVCLLVCSFLRHGPNLMLYPGAFESRPRREFQNHFYTPFELTNFVSSIDVRKPSAFRLPYEELAVTASDGVKLHAYLIARPAQHELQNNEHMQKLALNFSVSIRAPLHGLGD